ncbi:MAG: 16S rRNA (uracil(1498)-N(3))-methyltransferase [Vicinamibacterales bacterium]
MNLILLESSEIDDRGIARLRDVRARHIHDVLRATVGTAVRIGIVDGPIGVGTIERIDTDHTQLVCVFAGDAPPPRPAVDLLLALPRPKVLRRLWPHLAALGVGRVMLTNAARVERNYFDSHYVRPEGFRPLLIEGLQQARDTLVPQVTVHRQLRKLVEDELDGLCPETVRLVADPAATQSIRETLATSAQVQDRRVLLAIGPEGGWNAFERQLLRDHGFLEVSLGPRTLATTTACIALVTLVHDALNQ